MFFIQRMTSMEIIPFGKPGFAAVSIQKIVSNVRSFIHASKFSEESETYATAQEQEFPSRRVFAVSL